MADLVKTPGMTQMQQTFQDPVAQRAYDDAFKMAHTIKSLRTQAKQEKINPIVQALQQGADQYKAATTDEQRTAANTRNNQIRANLLAGGFSPTDIPTHLQGSDPLRGFQTPTGFEAPVTGYEGLGRKDAIAAKRQAAIDALTFENAPLETELLKAQIASAWRSANAPYSSGGGGGGSGSGLDSTMKWIYEQARLMANQDPRLADPTKTDPFDPSKQIATGEGFWNYPDLVGAHANTLMEQLGLKQPGGGGGNPGGLTDEEMLLYLK